MAAQSYEFTGKTTDEAIAEGLKTLKLRQDQVDIEVLNKGSRGIFGIGSEPALVRLTRRSTGVEEQTAKPSAPVLVEPKGTVPPVLPSAPVGANTVQQLPLEELQTTPTEAQAPEPNVSHETALGVMAPDSAPVTETTLAPEADAASDEILAQLAVELLTKMIQLMGFQGEVMAAWQTADSKTGEYEEAYLLLDVRGDDLGALIGRRGETLDNIQYLLRLMINQRLRQWKNIVVDIEQYKARRLTQLTQLALRMADQVTNSGRAVSLEPMPPNERRVVHLALRDHPTVYTESSGDGERRKVNIVAK